MAAILSIETSTQVCGLALHSDEGLLMDVTLHFEKSHSRELARQARFMLETAGTGFDELLAVAVAGGPGSYTGLRIGTSFAKGICYANEIPLIAIGSLSTMAYRVQRMIGEDAFYIPMMDARRMEVYSEVFDGNLSTVLPAQPVLLEEYDFDPWLDTKPCYFFGDGSEKAKTVITHPNARFVANIFPSANDMGILAWKRYRNEDFDDLAYFEPDYLKEFQATKPKKIF